MRQPAKWRGPEALSGCASQAHLRECRLREKGGRAVALPCHDTLEAYLHAYLDGTGLASDPQGPLFRTLGRGTGRLTRSPLPQANTYAMIQRRAQAAGDPR